MTIIFGLEHLIKTINIDWKWFFLYNLSKGSISENFNLELDDERHQMISSEKKIDDLTGYFQKFMNEISVINWNYNLQFIEFSIRISLKNIQNPSVF